MRLTREERATLTEDARTGMVVLMVMGLVSPKDDTYHRLEQAVGLACGRLHVDGVDVKKEVLDVARVAADNIISSVIAERVVDKAKKG